VRKLAPFDRLFDQSTPILFVCGVILVAMLGNSVYDMLKILLSRVLGEGWQLPGVIAAGGLVIVVLLTRFVWDTVFNLLQPATNTGFRAEESVRPRRALVTLVSPNPSRVEQVAIEHHQTMDTLTRCWLIVSPAVMLEGKAERLRTKLTDQGVSVELVPITDVNQARATYDAVQTALRHARILNLDNELIVDITGGTKPMSAGAALACRDLGLPIEYLATPSDDESRPIGRAMPVEVTLTPAIGQPK
jgi:hypothetical protein